MIAREVRLALSAPRSDVSCRCRRQNWIDGICGQLLHARTVTGRSDGRAGCPGSGTRRRQHAAELARPVAPTRRCPRSRPPTGTRPSAGRRAAPRLPRRVNCSGARRPPCGGTGTGTSAASVSAHDDVVGLAVGVLADARLGELGEADREVELGVGIVGGPALPAGLARGRCVYMPRQKLKPWPKVSALGNRAGTARGPNPPNRGRTARPPRVAMITSDQHGHERRSGRVTAVSCASDR